MEQNYNWEKKGFFSTKYRLFKNDVQIGNFSKKVSAKSSEIAISEKRYTLVTSGFFKQKTEIFDNLENKLVGKITYNEMTKATISINDQEFIFKYNSYWSWKKWMISSLNNPQIQYINSKNRGQIMSNTDDQLLIMCGLFVSNFYFQMMLIISIASIGPFLSGLFIVLSKIGF